MEYRHERPLASVPSHRLSVLLELSWRTINDPSTGGALAEASDRSPEEAAPSRAIEQATRELRDAQARLAQGDKLASIGRLAAGIAHEINNPAFAIQANLIALRNYLNQFQAVVLALRERQEALEDGQWIDLMLAAHDVPNLLEDTSKLIDDNLTAIDRVCSIVRDLRSFARIERQEVEMLDLNDLIRMDCHVTFNEIRHRAALLQDLQPLPRLAGDRGKLSQLIVNLLVNAAESIEEGAADRNQITIATCRVGEAIRLTVEDTGRGLSEEDQRRIFDPFYTTRDDDRRTGLGLALCADIVGHHLGQIHVTSRSGGGSSFEVILPLDNGLRVPTPRPAPVPARAATRTHAQRARVLIIDDDPMVRRALRRLLGTAHDIVDADGGEQALDRIRQAGAFDVILCDLMMPNMDGPMLYEVLGKEAPRAQARMVFLSGGAFTPRAKQFASTVRAQVLEKPVDKETLLDVIDRMVAQAVGR
jgi:signal transduction histidine kinase/CheY-like chemotaxis protein